MIFTCTVLQRAMWRVTVAAVLFICPLVSMAQTSLVSARDLAADAKTVERTGLPLIVMVSLAGCPHCEVVRRSHLLPLLRAGSVTPTALIRQVEINGQDILRDFSGRATTHAEFASRYKITLAPVVMFFDGKGEMISEPLVGSMIPDFYGAYFDAALTAAKSRLTRVRPSGR